MSRREEIRERLERDYSFVEGRRKALADIAYLLDRVEELEAKVRVLGRSIQEIEAPCQCEKGPDDAARDHADDCPYRIVAESAVRALDRARQALESEGESDA